MFCGNKLPGRQAAIAVLLFGLAACAGESGSGRLPGAVGGHLDLAGHDFSEDAIAYLSGEWWYYPGRLVDPAPGDAGANLVRVPHKWEGDVGPGRDSPHLGYATYALTLALPDDGTRYGIAFTTVSSAVRFTVNGEELFAAGVVSTDAAGALPGYGPGVYPLPQTGAPLRLVARISNYSHARGGFWEAARVGSLEKLKQQSAAKVALTVLMASAVGTMGLYHLLLWSLRYRDSTALTFAAVCMLITLRTLTVDDVYLQTLFPAIPWEWLLRIEYLTLSGMGGLGWVFFGQLFPREVTRPWVLIGVMPCALYFLLSLFASVSAFTGALPAFQGWVLYTIVFGPALIARAARNRREGAGAYLVCMIVLCLFMLHDTLIAEFSLLPVIQLAGGPFSLLPLGVALILLPQAVILAARTARSSRQLEARTQELSDTRDRLDDYAKELESRVAERTAELESANNQLARLARVDGLTGLGNRRQFDEQLQELWADHRRRQSPLGLLLVDVDEFKRYNDHYGHQRGDDALRAVAQAMRDAINRPRDELARYGGEEMTALLPDTDLEGASIIAERMRQAVAALDLPQWGSQDNVLTISVGVAVVMPTVALEPEALLQAADAALYQAKANGRNQVVAGSLEAEPELSKSPAS